MNRLKKGDKIIGINTFEEWLSALTILRENGLPVASGVGKRNIYDNFPYIVWSCRWFNQGYVTATNVKPNHTNGYSLEHFMLLHKGEVIEPIKHIKTFNFE